MNADIASFRSWLAQQGKSQRTAEVYAAMVEFGRRRGKVTLAVERARTKGSLSVAAAALRAWACWIGDQKLNRRVVRIACRRHVEGSVVASISNDERKALLSAIARLEEPYRSSMTVVVGSGLRLGTVLNLSRTQVEIGCSERVPLTGTDGTVVSLWPPPAEVQDAFSALVRFGGWETIQDLFGRDYRHAYRQIRVLLRYVCRKAGTRRIKPSELAKPGSPVQAILDEEARCA